MTYIDRNRLRFGFSMFKWEADWIPPQQHSSERDKVTVLAAFLSSSLSGSANSSKLGTTGTYSPGYHSNCLNDKAYDIWQFHMLTSWWRPTKIRKLFQHMTPSGTVYIYRCHCLTFDAVLIDLRWNGGTTTPLWGIPGVGEKHIK